MQVHRAVHTRTGCNDGALADRDAFKNDGVGADPGIFSQENPCTRGFLFADRNSACDSMTVIHEPAAACNPAVVADFNALVDVELTAATDKAIVTNDDARSAAINSIEVEIDIVLDPAIFADAHLVRPGNVEETKSVPFPIFIP